MKKVIISLLSIFMFFAGHAQITVTLGSALLQNPGTDVHLPVSVKGLNGQAGGKGVTGIELHIAYASNAIVYDTTLNFSSLTPSSQWFFGANGTEYSTNWLEPSSSKLNIPDNTVLFEIVVHYLGGTTELAFDTARCLLFDSAFNIIPGPHYVNGQITPSQGSGESRWNGTGPWNTAANWSNGIPGDSTNAVMESGMATVLSNAVCKSITINPGVTVNLSNGFSLTANRNYINNGTMNLQSDASGTGSLIVRGSVSGTGVNNFERYLNLSSGVPCIVSAPVSGATANVFGGNIAEKYIESSASWLAMSSAENLETGSGYRINGTAPSTVTFSGIFSTTDITRNNLAYSSNGQVETRGLNLLGNPYPSAIQWEQGNWGRINLDYAVYVWSGYKYVSWNGSIGALKDGIIPAMQGFFVKSNAAGASLAIPSGSRLHSTQPFYKTTDAVTNMIVVRFEKTNDASYYDETFVHILNGSTPGFDNNSDAYKLLVNNSYPQIYSKATDLSLLSINTIPQFVSIPLEVKTTVAGSYKITFGNIESFSQAQPLFFEDKITNTVINIRNSNEYVYASDGTAETGRFVLHFQEVGIDEPATTIFSVWNSTNKINISPKTTIRHIDRIEIFNLAGQLEYSVSNLDLPAAIQQENLTRGLYILRITSREGSFMQKLLIR